MWLKRILHEYIIYKTADIRTVLPFQHRIVVNKLMHRVGLRELRTVIRRGKGGYKGGFRG